MLSADTYPDYDGYSIYTTKAAVAAPQPHWPDLDLILLAEVCSCTQSAAVWKQHHRV